MSEILTSKGWPCTHISGNQDQADRLKTMEKLKAMGIRVLVSTDLVLENIAVYILEIQCG